MDALTYPLIIGVSLAIGFIAGLCWMFWRMDTEDLG
jgi:nitrogen fixation-related uncharacterized protein